jgi:aldose 1-epimerase
MSDGNGRIVRLASGDARCEIAPEAGGAIAAFWWEHRGRRLDWLRPSAAAGLARGDAGDLACFPLIPYGNRIRDARFRFCGREVVEQPGDHAGRHALHGHGWRRRWAIADRAADRLILEYEHPPDGGWPWPYRARQGFALSPEALDLTLEIENLSEALMPAGLGFHPFFPRTPEARLAAATSGVWLTDKEVLPTERTAVPQDWDFRAGRRVADVALDNVFTGWSGEAVVCWPERDARLTITAAQPLLSFLVVYTPPDRDFFCVEPASHCTDAINLAREGVADTGLRVLAPSVRRTASMRLRPEAS